MSLRAVAATVIAALLTLTACTATTDDGVPDAAVEAVEAYVDAIEAGDLEAATTMTEETAFIDPPDVRIDGADITSELPNAVATMHHAWVTDVGIDFTYIDEDGDGEIGAGESSTTDIVHAIVSYAVDEGVAAQDVAVTLLGDDRDDPASWRVTTALLVDGYVEADDEATVSIGDVEVGSASYVWGYPGTYALDDGDATQELQLGVEVGDDWRW